MIASPNYPNRCGYWFSLMKERGINWEPSFGERFWYCGQELYFFGLRNTTLYLLDDLPSVPFHESDLIQVENWEQDPTAAFLPTVETLLQTIHDRTTLYPVLIPGIEGGHEVWKVQHPYFDSTTADTLEEALLEMAIRVLEGK